MIEYLFVDMTCPWFDVTATFAYQTLNDEAGNLLLEW